MVLKAARHRGASGGGAQEARLFSADPIARNGDVAQAAAPPLAHQNGQTAPTAMSKSEREDLQRLVRQREKVLKSAARQRSSELLADFENQMGQQYSFDQDEIWEQAVEAVQPLVEKAEARIAARCRELGIPERFAPSVDLHWHARGYGNVLDSRRKELRVMAVTRIEAIEAKAITEIEMSCLEAQTQIAVAGLTSDVAKTFIARLPSVETLMPMLSFDEMAGETKPPVAEQLVSSNAIRQRRFRERQALRNAQQALRPPLGNGSDGDEDTPEADRAIPGDLSVPGFLRRPMIDPLSNKKGGQT